jgi:hypothetical protein
MVGNNNGKWWCNMNVVKCKCNVVLMGHALETYIS